MPQEFVDLHCDALSARLSGGGEYDALKFVKSGGILQCFAAFVRGGEEEYVAQREEYKRLYAACGLSPARGFASFLKARKNGGACCAFTVENIGFTEGREERISQLKKDGAIMASLVWNEENSLAYPNAKAGGGREKRGLKEAGREALFALAREGIIADVSHLSDGGTEEAARLSPNPVVASHSCADAATGHCRNLTDGQLRLLADKGGVVGVNFYRLFCGGGMEAVLRNILHMVNVAGEDAVALGSDWDGVPRGQSALYPEDMPEFFCELERILSFKAAEKIARLNFLRVFQEVCGGG